MMSFFMRLFAVITFKAWRVRREALKRRRTYDVIKSRIVDAHLHGCTSLKLKKRTFDRKDLLSFRPPMYQIARTPKNETVIFWRKDLMTEEVGGPKKIERAANGKDLTVENAIEGPGLNQLSH